MLPADSPGGRPRRGKEVTTVKISFVTSIDQGFEGRFNLHEGGPPWIELRLIPIEAFRPDRNDGARACASTAGPFQDDDPMAFIRWPRLVHGEDIALRRRVELQRHRFAR